MNELCSKCHHELFIPYVPICLHCSRDNPAGALAQLRLEPLRHRLAEAIRVLTILEIESAIQRTLAIYRDAYLLSGEPPPDSLRAWCSSLEALVRDKLLRWLRLSEHEHWEEARQILVPVREGGRPREFDRSFLRQYAAIMRRCVTEARRRMEEYMRAGRSAKSILKESDNNQRELLREAARFLAKDSKSRERIYRQLMKASKLTDPYAHVRDCMGIRDQFTGHAEIQASILVHQAGKVGHPDLIQGELDDRQQAVHTIRNLLLSRDSKGKSRGRRVPDEVVVRKLLGLHTPLTEEAIRKYLKEPRNKPR